MKYIILYCMNTGVINVLSTVDETFEDKTKVPVIFTDLSKAENELKKLKENYVNDKTFLAYIQPI